MPGRAVKRVIHWIDIDMEVGDYSQRQHLNIVKVDVKEGEMK